MIKMATNSDTKMEESVTVSVEEKPSKESISQVADKESQDETDLDQLLDSALGDFDKPLQPATSEEPDAAGSSPGLNILTTKQEGESEQKTETQPKEGPQPPPNQDALFEALFNDSPAAQQSVADFENVLSGLMSELGQGFGGDAQMASEMQKMFQTMAAGAAAMPNPAGTASSTSDSTSDSTTTQNPEDLTSTLTDTLNRLAQNARDLQEGQIPDEELLRSFGGMNLEGGDAELLPMVQTMMQSLLSKEVLYPSLREVVDKYQGWLDEKEPTLSSEDHHRYSEQHRLMSALCVEYEAEQASDSSTVKQERMGRIMELIQQMESLGQPPAEIVGDMNTAMPFDENGLPRIPGMPQGEQCSIM